MSTTHKHVNSTDCGSKPKLPLCPLVVDSGRSHRPDPFADVIGSKVIWCCKNGSGRHLSLLVPLSAVPCAVLSAEGVSSCRSWTRRCGGDQEASLLQHDRLECKCLHRKKRHHSYRVVFIHMSYFSFCCSNRNSSGGRFPRRSNQLQDDLMIPSISIQSSPQKHPEVPTAEL